MKLYIIPAVALIAAVGGWFAISGSTKESTARGEPAAAMPPLHTDMTNFAANMTDGLRALYGRLPTFPADVRDPTIDFASKTITYDVHAREMEASLQGQAFLAGFRNSYLKTTCPSYMTSRLGKQSVAIVQMLHYKDGTEIGAATISPQECAKHQQS